MRKRQLVWRRPESLRSLLGLSVSACYWMIGKHLRSAWSLCRLGVLNSTSMRVFLLLSGLMDVT